MELEDLGWARYGYNLKSEEDISDENIARVAVENRGGYLLYCKIGELEGIVRGKFMNTAKSDSQFPKVGDWVVFEKLQGEMKAIIKSVLPRKSKLSRKKAGEDIEEQIIAANIDLVFIVQGLDDDFNIGRLERYVAMAKEGNCIPIILLNKSDLANDRDEKLNEVQTKFPNVEVVLTSGSDGTGIEKIKSFISEGISIVFVGSSGVGKSTLINKIIGFDKQKTGEIRYDDSKGKHTTTKRELILLDGGGILIDTPGMRELGMWTQTGAIMETFDDINEIAKNCRFSDCDHQFSHGCAILAAVSNGEISNERYQRFIGLRNEIDQAGARKNKKNKSAQLRSLRKVIKRPEFKKK